MDVLVSCIVSLDITKRILEWMDVLVSCIVSLDITKRILEWMDVLVSCIVSLDKSSKWRILVSLEWILGRSGFLHCFIRHHKAYP